MAQSVADKETQCIFAFNFNIISNKMHVSVVKKWGDEMCVTDFLFFPRARFSSVYRPAPTKSNLRRKKTHKLDFNWKIWFATMCETHWWASYHDCTWNMTNQIHDKWSKKKTHTHTRTGKKHKWLNRLISQTNLITHLVYSATIYSHTLLCTHIDSSKQKNFDGKERKRNW